MQLDLSSLGISGSLPDTIGKLSNLIRLDLHFNFIGTHRTSHTFCHIHAHFSPFFRLLLYFIYLYGLLLFNRTVPFPSFLPSFLPSYLPSFLSPFLPSFLPSSFLPSFLLSFHICFILLIFFPYVISVLRRCTTTLNRHPLKLTVSWFIRK